jgi:hypothetical protein
MKPFTTLAVIVFSLIAVLQLIRALAGWEVTVNGISVPVWASWIACVVAAALAAMLRQEARRSPL